MEGGKNLTTNHSERVIFRKEYNPYTKQWGYLACYPDYEARPRYIMVRPFAVNDDGSAVFEPYGEASLEYFYSRQIIHKNDPVIDVILPILSVFEDIKFKVCERR